MPRARALPAGARKLASVVEFLRIGRIAGPIARQVFEAMANGAEVAGILLEPLPGSLAQEIRADQRVELRSNVGYCILPMGIVRLFEG